MDESELKILAAKLDKNGSFVLLKRYYYKYGIKLIHKKTRFQECIFIDSKDLSYLEELAKLEEQRVVKINNNKFRVRFMSKKAISLAYKVLPFLTEKKREAELLLEFSKLKRNGGYRLTDDLQLKREELYNELKKEKARKRS